MDGECPPVAGRDALNRTLLVNKVEAVTPSWASSSRMRELPQVGLTLRDYLEVCVQTLVCPFFFDQSTGASS